MFRLAVEPVVPAVNIVDTLGKDILVCALERRDLDRDRMLSLRIPSFRVGTNPAG